MISKNETKYIQSLFQKKKRDEEGVFVCEGVKLVQELIQSGFTVKRVYATQGWADAHYALSNLTVVTETELGKLSGLTTPNQVLAVAEKRPAPVNFLLQRRFTLMLDGIQDPGNFGTMLRTADWFGVNQVIASPDCADLYNPKTVQATMGSIFRVQVLYAQPDAILKDSPVTVYGALLHGEPVYRLQQVNEGILVIGNESRGIRENILPFIQSPVTIPAKGGAESLNAAVATGIMLSHMIG